MSLVDPARPEAPAVAAPAASRTTIIVSLAAHAVVIAAIVVVPLFGQVPLPAPSRAIESYVRAAAYTQVPLPSAPARSGSRTATPTPSANTPAISTAAPAPVRAPSSIAAGEPPAALAAYGSLEGVPGGLLAGAAAGIPPSPPLPPPPAVVTRPFRVGGDIRAPRKLRHVAPVYPAIAAQARVTGTVILEATISPAGDVSGVSVLRSVPLLDAAAVEAVRQWRYDPTRLNGTPVSVLLTVTVRFAQ
jgi:protein TonB